MLPQTYRLRRTKDFEILFKEGFFVTGSFLSLKIWKVDIEKYPKRSYSTDDLKIGFVVSVKLDKRAVVRNRLRRQMREAVRLFMQTHQLKKGYLLAFVANKSLIGQSFGSVQQDVEHLFNKSRLVIG